MVAVKVNGELLPADAYEATPKTLTLKNPPAGTRVPQSLGRAGDGQSRAQPERRR